MNHSIVQWSEVAARLRRLGLLLLAACALAFAACGQHGSPTNSLPQTTEISSPTNSLPQATEIGSPTNELPQATEIDHGNPNLLPVVALTFDSSNDPGGTAQILDTLKANGIKATFGVTGRWAELNPDLMRRIVNEGHSLINHSYHHWSFTGRSGHNPALTQAVRWNELDTTEAMIQKLTGATTKPYFRPPFGDDDASVNADVYARGYLYNVRWSVDSLGWQGLAVQAIVDRCLSLAKPGAIYLFHVADSRDFAALPAIIDGLRSMGYGFVTVPEMISSLGKG